MKTLKLLLILVCCAFACNASEAANPETGVWVSDKAELLLTDKIMIYFEKSGDDGVMAMVKVDSLAEDRCLFKADTILRGDIPSDFTITHLGSGDVLVNGDTLARDETIEICQPYDMHEANDTSTIGERLTEWRLGANVGVDETTNEIVVEVNTPRNMFIYHIYKGMYYLRAARIVNVNKGTLFYQNIRLMKNPNTNERTIYFSPRNQKEVMGELDVNYAAFRPDACYFAPNGEIYWSYTSHSPHQIILKGCGGDTYYINRRKASDKNLFEWIKYR